MNMHLLRPTSTRLRLGLCVAAVVGLGACGTTTPLPPLPPLPTVSSPQPAPAPAPAPIARPSPAPAPMLQPSNPSASFGRPAPGPVLARFDGDAVKGIDIGGRMGEPVQAARDGRVVLVSSALPAYGTMVILKHDDDFITAYAHVSKALVNEGDAVVRGQPIAEMGQSGTDRVKLRFEIRKGGAAVDPEPYLNGSAY